MFDKSLFDKQECVAVALSGGKDSVFLLHLLYNNAKSLGITVKAINVEHGIRGEASVKDSEFVKKLCLSLNVPLRTFTVNAPLFALQHGYSYEQSARILRYECFNNALIEGFCDKIATAHHASDNAETVLFNLFRGSALSGVSGIPQSALQGKIIRPILNVQRQEIDNYIKEHNLEYVTDESNQNCEYSRNFIRNVLLPQIEDRFLGATQAINRFSQIASEENQLLNDLAKELIINNSVKITGKDKIVLFKRACLLVMKKMGFERDFTKTHLNAIIDLTKKHTGKKIDLKFGVTAHKKEGEILFIKNLLKDEKIYPLNILEGVETSEYKITFKRVKSVTKKQLTSGKALYFDGDKLPYSAVIRTKREGDYILTFSGKTKSLKKFFTDKKIDLTANLNLPLIAADNQIMAVCGVDISKIIAVDENTTNIIKITVKKKGE